MPGVGPCRCHPRVQSWNTITKGMFHAILWVLVDSIVLILL
jgi:hypothetical protein